VGVAWRGMVSVTQLFCCVQCEVDYSGWKRCKPPSAPLPRLPPPLRPPPQPDLALGLAPELDRERGLVHHLALLPPPQLPPPQLAPLRQSVDQVRACCLWCGVVVTLRLVRETGHHGSWG
jgi:hypothetical protein